MEAATALRDVRERDQLRRLFSRSASTVELHIKNQDLAKAHIEVEYLQEKFNQLETLTKTIQNRMLLAEEFNEALYQEEVEKSEGYTHRWCKLRKITKSNPTDRTSASHENKLVRNYKLPKIELKKFDDDLKNWLGFWGQFRKIHEDATMNEEDKFQYLIQATEEGSNARTLVESFPPSAENYNKAVKQLKARFGREDILIQVYVRQLLSLVLNNSRMQVSIRDLYDKLSTYLLSLESLGIAKQKYETILYPLVESSIPETVLVAWNRSNLDQSTDQLAKLLSFLKSEVDAEERIRMSRSDFSCSVLNPSLRSQASKSLPTAAALVSNAKSGKEISDINSCCFCDKNNHNTFECSKASKMSLGEKREAIKKKGCCYICLRKGHMSNRCKTFVKCISCGKRHYTILCPDVHSKSSENRTSENVLVCARINTTTLLQTLIVNVSYEGKSKKVRALLDSGAQRSYVTAAVVKELGLQPTGTEKIGHMLFGGVEQPAEVYKCFEIQVSNLEDTFITKIKALGQADLCGHLPKVKNMTLTKKLRDLRIKISDIEFADTEISLLIGSDYLGSIITDKLVHLDDNLIAVNTNLGWTLQGPISVHSTVNTTSVSCFSKTNLADLWSVELLGIQDPYEKQCKNVAETEVLKVFNDNISVNVQGRYEVSLLWKEGCPKLCSNYEVASKRLESTTKKLKSTGNLKMYNDVLQSWFKEDIIEKVTDDDINEGHYLPHHGVVKPSSTSTCVRPVYDASTNDKNGWSLNGCMNKGINMIELIQKLLIQFRKGTYGVVSDIKQAFLQISIEEKDRDYLKFLWWEDIEKCDKVITYRHKRVVFGITCSLFLLSATIHHQISTYTEDYRNTATKLKESFYVDNCVASFDSIDELNTFISESKTVMNKGRFDLRGWVTAPRRIDDTVELSVLGMTWNTLQDDIKCNVSIKETIQEKKDWPKSCVGELNEANEEMVHAEVSQSAMVCTDITAVPFSQRLMYFSKYNRIVRLVAWILRMSCHVRKRFNIHQADITNDEYINAENSLIRLLQKENFTEEKLPKNLNTNIDDEGIMRVRTRLELSQEDKNFVNPVLLPGRNEIVQRLVRQRHEKLNHAGTQLLLSNLRNDFWILNIRRLSKSTVSRCIICKRDKSKHYDVPEAPLPAARIEATAVFQVTGIDLAGPLYLRNKEKCWIVLFTCATYRAVHLELVESLSTNSFLMALRRFIARRGRMNVIYTDCGGNFQGSANLLKEVNWTEVEAATAAVPPPIKWRFSPPRAPWWGGWWERLIKVVKDMLRRILGKESVTWIELSTLLCDCEAVINSRPLTYVATDDASAKALTPMMFLHALPSTETNDLDQVDSKNLNIRYQYLNKLREDFRQRFRNEYIALICSKDRCKPNFPKVNDIVLIETDSKRLYWPLGIIKELLTGADGHSRVARVQTATGEWVRACQRLYPLELTAVTDEWRRASTNGGKSDTSLGDRVLSTDTILNSDLSDCAQLPSATTRHGRTIKLPQRFLD